MQIMCVIIDVLYYFGGDLGNTYFSSWVYGMHLLQVLMLLVKSKPSLTVVKDWSLRDYTFL